MRSWDHVNDERTGIAQFVVRWASKCIGDSTLFRAVQLRNFFPLDLRYVLIPLPTALSNESTKRLCAYAFRGADSKDADVHVIGG